MGKKGHRTKNRELGTECLSHCVNLGQSPGGEGVGDTGTLGGHLSLISFPEGEDLPSLVEMTKAPRVWEASYENGSGTYCSLCSATFSSS